MESIKKSYKNYRKKIDEIFNNDKNKFLMECQLYIQEDGSVILTHLINPTFNVKQRVKTVKYITEFLNALIDNDRENEFIKETDLGKLE